MLRTDAHSVLFSLDLRTTEKEPKTMFVYLQK